MTPTDTQQQESERFTPETLDALMEGAADGPWTVCPHSDFIEAPSEKGGNFPLGMVRGWGYYTGGGHGALGLSQAEGLVRQKANARLLAAAPSLAAQLKDALERERELKKLSVVTRSN